ncbi:MAG: hypothetical protein ACHQ50_07455 [Fimbriimonadales bacterium]
MFGLFLSVTAALAFYSATAGFTDALAFVRGDKDKLTPLPGTLGSFAQLVPSGTSYGFYAPQVCAEFRLRMRLGSTVTRETRDVSINLGSETAMLVSSLSSTTQEQPMAKTVAASYASYGFTRNPWADSAEVQLEVELMPRLSEATTRKAEWVTMSRFYFRR